MKSLPDRIDAVCKFLVVVIAGWWICVVAHAFIVGRFAEFAR